MGPSSSNACSETGSWSGEERILLEVTASLFDADSRVSLWEAGHRLSAHHWLLVMEALALFAKLPANGGTLTRAQGGAETEAFIGGREGEEINERG
jgi:hypothetical protein